MNVPLSPYIAIPTAIVAVIGALLIWYVLVRPVPEFVGVGVIAEKTFEPARTSSRYRGGPRREDFSKGETRIPDGYLFRIRLDESTVEIRYFLEARAAAPFQVGQRVKVVYLQRSIPLVWNRTYVKSMAAVTVTRE